MKVAVLIAGEYREFEIAHKFWSFLNWENVDCYFSTWNTSVFVDKNPDKHHIIEPVTKDQIKNLIKVNDIKVDPKPQGLSSSNGCMMDRWHSVINMMNNSGIVYDKVILIRPDIALDYDEHIFKQFFLSSSNSDDDIYGIISCKLNEPINLKVVGQMSDLMLLGTQSGISRILQIPVEPFYEKHEVNGQPTELPISPMIDIHAYLAKHCSNLYKNLSNMPISRQCIVRSTCRGLINPDFKTCQLKSKEWWESRHKRFYDMGDNAWGQHYTIHPKIYKKYITTPNLFDMWKQYDFSEWWESSRSLNWKSPDDEYNYNKNYKNGKIKELSTYKENEFLYNYNSYGFRTMSNSVRDFEDGHGYPTFAVGGCSVTEGIGLPEEHIWHSFLLNKLYELSDKPIAKFNLGKGGISAAATIRYMYVSIEDKGLRPDFVYFNLPPVTRKEIITKNEEGKNSILNFLPAVPRTPYTPDQQELITFLEKSSNRNNDTHEYFLNLLFIKYYLELKNIPWFFSCWANDVQINTIPQQLRKHFIPRKMNLEVDVDKKYKIYKQEVARDCAHYGPNSHFEFGSEVYNLLLKNDKFLTTIKKWKKNE